MQAVGAEECRVLSPGQCTPAAPIHPLPLCQGLGKKQALGPPLGSLPTVCSSPFLSFPCSSRHPQYSRSLNSVTSFNAVCYNVDEILQELVNISSPLLKLVSLYVISLEVAEAIDNVCMFSLTCVEGLALGCTLESPGDSKILRPESYPPEILV